MTFEDVAMYFSCEEWCLLMSLGDTAVPGCHAGELCTCMHAGYACTTTSVLWVVGFFSFPQGQLFTPHITVFLKVLS